MKQHCRSVNTNSVISFGERQGGGEQYLVLMDPQFTTMCMALFQPEKLTCKDALSVTGLPTLSLRKYELCGRLVTADQDPSLQLSPLLPPSMETSTQAREHSHLGLVVFNISFSIYSRTDSASNCIRTMVKIRPFHLTNYCCRMHLTI